MLREKLNSSTYSFFDKLKTIDYFLILIVMLIGCISVFAIYSTESGNFSYYTKNHLLRLIIFFLMFLAFSFIRIKEPDTTDSTTAGDGVLVADSLFNNDRIKVFTLDDFI